jgi:hypothetical protein
MDDIIPTRTVIPGSSTAQSYKVWTFTLPSTNSFCKFEIDGWLTPNGKCGVHKAILRINGKIIDSQSVFVDRPVNTLNFLSGQYLKMFALVYSVVTIDIFADSEAVGSVVMLSCPYNGKFDKRNGIIYDDLFTNGDRLESRIHYQDGQAIAYVKINGAWRC